MGERPSLCTANGALPPPPIGLQRAEGSERRLHLKGPRPKSGLWVERAAQCRGVRYERRGPRAPPYGCAGGAGGAAARRGAASGRPPVRSRCLAPRVGAGQARAARVPWGAGRVGPPHRMGGGARAWREGAGPTAPRGGGAGAAPPLPRDNRLGAPCGGGRVPGTPPRCGTVPMSAGGGGAVLATPAPLPGWDVGHPGATLALAWGEQASGPPHGMVGEAPV